MADNRTLLPKLPPKSDRLLAPETRKPGESGAGFAEGMALGLKGIKNLVDLGAGGC